MQKCFRGRRVAELARSDVRRQFHLTFGDRCQNVDEWVCLFFVVCCWNNPASFPLFIVIFQKLNLIRLFQDPKHSLSRFWNTSVKSGTVSVLIQGFFPSFSSSSPQATTMIFLLSWRLVGCCFALSKRVVSLYHTLN